MSADAASVGPVDWAGHAGSPADASSLVDLAGVVAGSLCGAELVDAIVASEKALSLLTGLQMRLLAAFAVPFVAGDPMRLAARLARKSCMTGDDSPEQVQLLVPDAAVSLAAAEVAAALRISPVTAGIRVREAETMTTVLAPTLAALEAGLVDRGKARVIAEQCAPLSEEHTAVVQDLVVPAAGGLSTSELREVTGQAVITVDPAGAQDRHEKAAARRELALQALPDAMASLKAFLPADGAVKIFQVSDLLATGTAGVPGDSRGIGARRIDALVDIADQLLTYGHLDLSHYLGRELPDHGTPPEPTEQDTDTDNDTTGSATDAGTVTATDQGSATGTKSADTADTAGGSDRADIVDSATGGQPDQARGPFITDPATNTASDADTAGPVDSGAADPDVADARGADLADVNHADLADPDDADRAGAEGAEPVNVKGADFVEGNEADPAGSADADRGDADRADPAGADEVEVAVADRADPDDRDEADPADIIGAADVHLAGVNGSADAYAAESGSPTNSKVATSTTVAAGEPTANVDSLVDIAGAGADAEGVIGTELDVRPPPDKPASRVAPPQTPGPAPTKGKVGKAKSKAADKTFTRQGRRPHLSVTLGLGTLAGLNEFPGTLAGFGAIPAGLARSIAKSAATITALLTNPETGSVIQAGELTYRPRQDLRDQVAALLEVCQFPSCRQPVWRCDIDHRQPFDHEHPEQGGQTNLENNGPLCRRHHLFKHHTEWRCRPDPDRTVLHWSSPTGHQYSKYGRQAVPPELWVSTTGTAVAENLDRIAFFTTWGEPLPAHGGPSGAASTSLVEQLLNSLVLQNQFNKRPLEYEHIESAWNIFTRDGSPEPNGYGEDLGDGDDDAPPF